MSGLIAAKAHRAVLGTAISRRRRGADYFLFSLCGAALVLLVAPLVWLLAGVFAQAISGWQWSVLTETTTGVGGGLANTIVGTFVLLTGVGTVAGGVGIAFGIFLAEVAPPGRLTGALEATVDLLAGIPSIVFGYVGYIALVVGLHWGFSLLAAVLVLSLLVVPYVAKATFTSLSRVPTGYREGAVALGMSRVRVLAKILFFAAAPGIATGLILALAISLGETAPLLYTAGFSNSYPSTHLLHAPVPYLTYATWTFYDEPAQSVKQLAYDASLLLVVLVFLLILASRLVVRATQRYSPQAVGKERRRRISRAEPGS